MLGNCLILNILQKNVPGSISVLLEEEKPYYYQTTWPPEGIKELAEGTRVFTCPPEPPFPFPLSLCVIFSLLPGTLLETFSLLSVPSLAAHESS